MIYTPQEIKRWDVDSSGDGKTWMPARPITFWNFGRFKTAWFVLIGKYDALDWQ
jgi:hypothetical protein